VIINGKTQNALPHLQTAVVSQLCINGWTQELFELGLKRLVLWTRHIDPPNMIRIARFLMICHFAFITDSIPNVQSVRRLVMTNA